MEELLRNEEEICPICLETIEPEDKVIRVMDRPVHKDCFQQQSEAWTAA